jgi:hypothetical protein
MKATFLILFLFGYVVGQTPARKPSPSASAQKPSSELARLRVEYLNATKEYKSSLYKLLAIYEKNVSKAEEKLTLSKQLLSDGLVGATQVEEAEMQVVSERSKAEGTQRQILSADEEIKSLPSEEELAKEYKHRKAVRRRSSQPTCDNWTLTAYRRQNGRTVVFAFKIVCKD